RLELAKAAEGERLEEETFGRDQTAIRRRIERDEKTERTPRIAVVIVGPCHLEQQFGALRREVAEIVVLLDRVAVAFLFEGEPREGDTNFVGKVRRELAKLFTERLEPRPRL